MRSGITAAATRKAAATRGRILIVSNRLPFTARLEGRALRMERSSGGLATGLRGVQEQLHALWIGWSGLPEAEEARHGLPRRLTTFGSVAVPLDEEEISGFYRRYSNMLLWPVLHGWTDQPRPDPSDWALYREVNERFASAIADRVQPGDCVWVHDYHLMLVPQMLRERGCDTRIGFFLHTPFPDPATFAAVPQHADLLTGMLGANVIGFHTPYYAQNFRDAVAAALPHPVEGSQVTVGERTVRVCAEPMGIDVAAFERLATDGETVAEADRIRGHSGAAVFLGVDRLDYTKGVLQRLLAFERLLEQHPELNSRVRLIQIAVPTREDLRAYRDLRHHVEALVDRINLRFGRAGWVPIEYLFGSVDLNTLSALYRSADVMLVTPLRDGMNLVAKEFIASRADGDGVLVLSQYAGAAVELRAALLVNPTRVNHLANVYHAALTMSPVQRQVRMRWLRKAVERSDVFRWASRFLERVQAGDPVAADALRPEPGIGALA